ncbi:hypothetical protein PCANC_24489 [Puccinia coronata f. sp. avenae]|uniref:Uncharacterized protein n=1 Tax=Puccinia coronata f. sp. avenae TaxID=200324 RepID=A0A2N5RYB4_9BASI|nr:hypothetical protein PCANC_24489 [Puccinia coronata f. sp. avenae]
MKRVMSGKIIDTIVISEIVEEGQARLQNLVNDYILRSVYIISIMKELLLRDDYERLAIEAIWLRRLADSLGANRVHALCNSIALQCQSNPMYHEHYQIKCKLQLLERQNFRGHQALLQMLAYQGHRQA